MKIAINTSPTQKKTNKKLKKENKTDLGYYKNNCTCNDKLRTNENVYYHKSCLKNMS